MPPITPAQVRGARGMLDWSKVELARAAGVSVSLVLSAEGRDPRGVPAAAMGALRAAFEAAGIAFVSDAGGAGVCLAAPQPSVFSRFL